MKKFMMMAVASGMALAAATPAGAAVVIGSFNLNNVSGTYNGGSQTALTATGLDFGLLGTGVGNGFGTNGQATLQLGTGSFTAFNNSTVSISDVSLAAFANPNVNPFLTIGTGAGQVLVNFSNAAIQRDPTSVTIQGAATFLNGGDTSFGTFSLSSNSQNGQASNLNFTFTSNASATGAVPEPATWGMMIVGFGLVGGVLRRRKTSVAFA